jgi:tripartite-type tricarboxylate transporter receptor subunit TctC
MELIVPFQSGGPLDVVARVMGQKLGEKLGQPVVISNKPGAGGNIGTALVAKAAADGLTIGMVTSSTHGINTTLFGTKMPYDAVKDFAPVTLAAEMKNVLVVHPSLKVKTVGELIEYARANPGKIVFGSAGSGTAQHLTAEMFKASAGIDMVHVPYRGASQAVPDLISGRITMMFLGVPDSLEHIRSGALVPLAISTKERSPLLPDIKPLAEQGFPDFDVRTWFGVVAPAGTPSDIVKELQLQILRSLNEADIKGRLEKLGIDVVTMSPSEFADFIKSEITKWQKVIKDAGVETQ